MTRVKICGLARIEDAALALELGADALGFVLDPASPRYVGDDAELLAALPRLGPYALRVAVFGRLGLAPAAFQLVQFAEGNELDLDRPSLRALRVRPEDRPAELLARIGEAPAALLDAFAPDAYGGTGARLDWEVAAEVAAGTSAKIVLAGGLTPENVAEAIARVRPYAVDVSGGVEAEPRRKDAGKLRAFIEAAKPRR